MKKNAARAMRAICLVIVLIATSMVATAGPAAAVTCWGDYCSGKDPVATGCSNDAYTVTSKDVGAALLEVRWSPTCKTNWARMYIYPTKTLAGGTLWAEQSTGYRQNKSVPSIASWSAQSPTYWSPMIYSPVKCVSAKFVHAPGYAWNVVSTLCR